jgi:hypothetical protein
MRCCIASSTTSRLKDQHNSALTPLPPPTGQPSAASRKITSLWLSPAPQDIAIALKFGFGPGGVSLEGF